MSDSFSCSVSPISRLVNFELFPGFPAEIRTEIFRLTLQPRIINILFSETIGFYAKCPLPAVFHVNKDSRKILETIYSKAFASEKHPAATFFNFKLDTLQIYGLKSYAPEFFANLSNDERGKLKYLAIHDEIDMDTQSELGDFDIVDVVDGALRKRQLQFPLIKSIEIVSELTQEYHLDNFLPENLPHQFYDQFPQEFSHYCELKGSISECTHAACEGGGCLQTIVQGPCPCFVQPTIDQDFEDLDVEELVGRWEWRMGARILDN